MPSDGGAVVNSTAHQKPGGLFRQGYCNAPHPDNPDPATCDPDDEFVFCRRQPDHWERDDLGHSAFVFRISEPEYWGEPPAVELDDSAHWQIPDFSYGEE